MRSAKRLRPLKSRLNAKMKEEHTVIIHSDKWIYEHAADEIEETGIGDVPRIYGLQNPIYFASEWHAAKSQYRPVRRSFIEDVRPRGAAP